MKNLDNLLEATEAFMWAGKQLHDGVTHFGDDDTRALRLKLLREEFQEYLDAEDNDDLVEVIDGLLDIIVVAWGTALSYVGPNKATRAAMEVARSNLDKVRGPGLPILNEDGKIQKPPQWRAPDIAGVLA